MIVPYVSQYLKYGCLPRWQVNDLDSPDCPMTIATSRGYLHYPAPAIHLSTATSSARQSNPQFPASQPLVSFPVWCWPGLARRASQTDVALAETAAGAAANTDDDVDEGRDLAPEPERDANFHLHTSDFSTAAPMDVSPRPSDVELPATATTSRGAANIEDVESVLPGISPVADGFTTPDAGRSSAGDPGRSSPTIVGAPWDVGEAGVASSARAGNGAAGTVFPIVPIARRQEDACGVSGQRPYLRHSALPSVSSRVFRRGALSQVLPPTGDDSGREPPFVPGLAQHGQTLDGIGGQTPASAAAGVLQSMSAGTAQPEVRLSQQNQPTAVASGASLATLASAARVSGGNNAQVGLGQGLVGPHSGVRVTINQIQAPGRGISIPNIGDVEAAQAALAAAELPCTVKLRIWPHDIKKPSASLDPDTCRLTIPHAVLCRYAKSAHRLLFVY